MRRVADRSTTRRCLLVIGAAVGLAGYAFGVEPRRQVVRGMRLRLPGWPPQLAGLRVGVIADLHAGGPHVDERRIAAVVTRMNHERPDLLVFLGDFIDPEIPLGEAPAPEPLAAQLGEAQAPLGAFSVLGNHDWAYDGDRVARALRRANIAVLENQAIEVPAWGQRLWVAGLGDLRERHADLKAALEPVPANAPVLLLSHDPDVFPDVPARVSLTLSGHTHAGQVNLPLLRQRFIPSRFGDRYARGHIQEFGRHLFVSSGVGTAGLPVRFLAPPEIAVLTLDAAEADAI
jgi:uncharacterized protein